MLISHSALLLFVTGAALLLVIPGPAVTYVVSRSIGHGRAAGLVSVTGIVVGTLLHVTAATLGLSALLASSALAFQFRFSLTPWPSASARASASVARSATFQEALSSPSVWPPPSPAPKRNDLSKRAGVRGKLLSCQLPLRNNSTSCAPAVKSSAKRSAPWPRGLRRASRPRN